ncbi:MAG: hypothetical protein DHS20C20_20400 [Ardenticatenaceae bacterium]|nr:MAG: hypothetical protein DHS20C20_20400 [Ardenticatenaceae bacterium]
MPVSDFITKKMVLREAVNWPLYECLISKEWRDTHQLAQVVVTRRGAAGYIVVAGFMLDLGCLGIKDALTIGFATEARYRNEYKSHLLASQEMMPCDLDLAAKVIEEAQKYAAGIGFKPHRDSKDALKLLAGANPQNCSEPVPVGGEDGKPFYFAGPYDDVDRILRVLDRTVGQGNYDFIVFHGEDPFGDFEDEEY